MEDDSALEAISHIMVWRAKALLLEVLPLRVASSSPHEKRSPGTVAHFDDIYLELEQNHVRCHTWTSVPCEDPGCRSENFSQCE